MPTPNLDERLDALASDFAAFEPAERLELLADLGAHLPKLNDDEAARRTADIGRVRECLTPVWLYVSGDPQAARVRGAAGEQASVVAGLVGVLVRVCDTRPAAEIAALPEDVLRRLGLAEGISMQRTQGFAAACAAVRQGAATLARTTPS